MIMKITILGAGAFGLALGQLWHQHSDSMICLWTPFAKEKEQIDQFHCVSTLPNITLNRTLYITTQLEEALLECQLLIIAVPSPVVRSVLEQVKQINDTIPTVIVSKGIEKNSLSRLSEIYYQVGLKGELGYLAGPTFAEEIINNVPSGFTLATTSSFVNIAIHQLFQNTNTLIQVTDDILSTEYSSSLKNILAILMGAIQSKYLSATTRAYFFTLSYQEFERVIVALGGHRETLISFSGLGDLLLTCDSKTSRNYQYGYLLATDRQKAKEYIVNTTVEGVETLEAFLMILEQKEIKSPLLLFLWQFIQGEVIIEDILNI